MSFGSNCWQASGSKLASTKILGSPEPTIPPSPSAPASQFITLAYATDGIFADLIPYDKLTHLNYSFLTPNAAQTDTFDYMGSTCHINGIPTLQTRTCIVMEKAAGMLFWALDHDAQGNLSLRNDTCQTARRSL